MTTDVAARSGTEAPNSAMEAIERAFSGVAGRRLLDIGCGTGALAAALAKQGAMPVGVDPVPEMIAAARRAVPAAGFPDVAFHVASGEALPFADHIFDGAVFFNSFHHVPPAAMTAALVEAVRVVRPGAAVVVIEPHAGGSFFEVLRPIEDETGIRAAARAAIRDAVDRKLVRCDRALTFTRIDVVADLDAFIAKVVAVDPARAAVAEARRDLVAAAFARHGEPVADGVRLRQPHQVDILAAPR